jgi:hypothetical protein
MLQPRVEHERPSEWLRWLAETPDGYEQLLEQAGGLARAAYRLARARCRVHGGASETPTLRELQAAALSLAQQLGMVDRLPITSLLASDCEEHGLPVIRPIPPAPSSPPPSSIPSLKRAS